MMLAGGEVLTFGYGRNMRLGHGNCDNQFLPRTIDSLWGTRVVEVLRKCWLVGRRRWC